MFKFLNTKLECKLFSPICGKSIPLANVSDEMFAEKLLGDGVGFDYVGDTVYSPCDGRIIMIANTKHAFGIKTKNGAELLLHVGLDTVNLNGKGFEVLVNINDKVKAHQPLLKINRKIMEENNIDLTTPLVVTNLNEFELIIQPYNDVTLESLVATIKRK